MDLVAWAAVLVVSAVSAALATAWAELVAWAAASVELAELETPAEASAVLAAELAASAARVVARAVLAVGVALMADAMPPAWLVARVEARPAWVDTAAKAATVRPLAWVDTHARAAWVIAVRRASIRRSTAVRAAVGAVAAAADVADRFDIYT